MPTSKRKKGEQAQGKQNSSTDKSKRTRRSNRDNTNPPSSITTNKNNDGESQISELGTDSHHGSPPQLAPREQARDATGGTSASPSSAVGAPDAPTSPSPNEGAPTQDEPTTTAGTAAATTMNTNNGGIVSEQQERSSSTDDSNRIRQLQEELHDADVKRWLSGDCPATDAPEKVMSAINGNIPPTAEECKTLLSQDVIPFLKQVLSACGGMKKTIKELNTMHAQTLKDKKPRASLENIGKELIEHIENTLKKHVWRKQYILKEKWEVYSVDVFSFCYIFFYKSKLHKYHPERFGSMKVLWTYFVVPFIELTLRTWRNNHLKRMHFVWKSM